MKIYPSKHRIKQVAESNIDTDISIPLAYLNRENVEYKIDRIIAGSIILRDSPGDDFCICNIVSHKSNDYPQF